MKRKVTLLVVFSFLIVGIFFLEWSANGGRATTLGLALLWGWILMLANFLRKKINKKNYLKIEETIQTKDIEVKINKLLNLSTKEIELMDEGTYYYQLIDAYFSMLDVENTIKYCDKLIDLTKYNEGISSNYLGYYFLKIFIFFASQNNEMARLSYERINLIVDKNKLNAENKTIFEILNVTYSALSALIHGDINTAKESYLILKEKNVTSAPVDYIEAKLYFLEGNIATAKEKFQNLLLHTNYLPISAMAIKEIEALSHKQ